MGTPNCVIQPVQKVQNTTAHLILRAPCHQNCTPLLQQLHWLSISEQIKYKTVCMCYNTVTGSAPSYLSELLYLYSLSRSLRSSSDTGMLKIQRFNRKTHGYHLSISERIKYKTACMCYSAITGSAPSFWAATPLRSFLLSPLFVRHTHAQNTTIQLQNPWLLHFLTLWPPHPEQSPPRHQAFCYSLFLQKPTQDVSLLRIF